MKEIVYIAVDVEADGNTPGLNSMLSLGAVALDRGGTVLSEFSVNVEPLECAEPDEETMAFWAKFPEAYAATQVNPVPAEDAMEGFASWFERFENPQFVFYPPKFDALYVYWYLQVFVERMNYTTSPDMFDTQTLVSTLLRVDDISLTKKKYWPNRWKKRRNRHVHVALDDAREQGAEFIKILNESLHGEANRRETVGEMYVRKGLVKND